MWINKHQANVLRAAELFHENKRGFSEIAKLLECPEEDIPQLLDEAIESGTVEIKIKRPVDKFPTLALKIKNGLNLKEVVVVSAGHGLEQSFRNVGYASAEFLAQILKNNMKIGISWGKTLSYLVRQITIFPHDLKNIEVIQFIGGIGLGDPTMDGPDLAQQLAKSLKGTYHYIHAPCVVESVEIANELLNVKQIQDTINRSLESSIIITSVGSLEHDLSSLKRTGYFEKDPVPELLALGAIGHCMARLIDSDGKPIKHEFNDRIVGAPLDVLRNAKYSIGIGAQHLKAPVFYAAIKGGLFNVLVIDDETAKELIRLADL